MMNKPLDLCQESDIEIAHNCPKGSRVARMTVAVMNALRDQTGSGLAEYGLLLFFILVVSLTILGTIGGTIANLFTQVNTKF